MSTRNLNRRAILAGAATAVAVVQPGAVRIANARPVALTVGGGVPASAEQRLFEIEREVRDLGLKITATGEISTDAEQDAFNDLVGDQDNLFEEAIEIRPVTLAGIHCKARLARAWDPNHHNMPTELADSVVDDLIALQGMLS